MLKIDSTILELWSNYFFFNILLILVVCWIWNVYNIYQNIFQGHNFKNSFSPADFLTVSRLALEGRGGYFLTAFKHYYCWQGVTHPIANVLNSVTYKIRTPVGGPGHSYTSCASLLREEFGSPGWLKVSQFQPKTCSRKALEPGTGWTGTAVNRTKTYSKTTPKS